ncbi:hypothetical protein D920_00706 [Enterococcus faecalis 13-SD-W-01]|nr:hypothetical protein D920_00706 [Enterococcus faecalis 13-SD-W-01]
MRHGDLLVISSNRQLLAEITLFSVNMKKTPFFFVKTLVKYLTESNSEKKGEI